MTGDQSQNNVTKLIPTKSNEELAAEFKLRLVEAHEPLLKLFDEITKAGFTANVQIAPGALNKMIIQRLTISKSSNRYKPLITSHEALRSLSHKMKYLRAFIHLFFPPKLKIGQTIIINGERHKVIDMRHKQSPFYNAARKIMGKRK